MNIGVLILIGSICICGFVISKGIWDLEESLRSLDRAGDRLDKAAKDLDKANKSLEKTLKELDKK
jgi:exonuclease VII small subunit